jgi:hypothetical protein
VAGTGVILRQVKVRAASSLGFYSLLLISKDTTKQNGLSIPIHTPSPTEIKKALNQTKNGKSPGTDNIPPEILTLHDGITDQLLNPIFENIRKNKKMPAESRKGITDKLPKKGNLTGWNNWRAIILLSLPSAIFCTTIINRIKDSIGKRLRKEQAGFREKGSRKFLINTLLINLEQTSDWSTIVFEKAFESVKRKYL